MLKREKESERERELCVCVCVWGGDLNVAEEESINPYRILVGKLEGKRPLGRPRRRWVDSIKMDLKQIGWDGMDLIDLASGSIKCWEFLE
jgi:hypothetical protein